MSGNTNLSTPLGPLQGSSSLNGQISKRDIHELLYSGSNTLIFTHYMPWFCVSHDTYPDGWPAYSYPIPDGTTTQFGTPEYYRCNGHVEVGYSVSSPEDPEPQQFADMVSRGFNGVVVDWYGPGKDPENTTTGKVVDSANYTCAAPQSCSVLFSTMEDQGAWKSGYTIGGTQIAACTTSSGDANCILNHLKADFDYMLSNHFNQNSYLRIQASSGATHWIVSPNGRPVVFLFVDEGGWNITTTSWASVWSSLQTYLQSYGSNQPYLLFRDRVGFTHPANDGAYAWANAWGNLSYNDLTSGGYRTMDPNGFQYLDDVYYNATTAYSSKITFGAAWKGFDNERANWAPANKKWNLPQRCGQEWLDTLARIGQRYNSGNQLPFLQIPTWNDYDEGSALETGIDNCVSVNASSNGVNLSWTLGVRNVQPSAFANENTIHHYEVYESNDQYGSELTLKATVPVGTYAIPLSSMNLSSGTHYFYVYAAAKASLTNQLSNIVTVVY